jgi:hypothetical protein
MAADYPRTPRAVCTFAEIPATPCPFELDDSDGDVPSPYGDLILPDPTYVAPVYSDDEDWIRPAIGENFMTPTRPRILPKDQFTLAAKFDQLHSPSEVDCLPAVLVMTDARYREAQQLLSEATVYWEQQIAIETEIANQKMSELIASQKQELKRFDDEFEAAGRFRIPDTLRILGLGGDTMVFRAKPTGFKTQPSEPVPREIQQKRNVIIERHRRAIVRLNEECQTTMRHLEQRRDDDLAIKHAAMAALRKELGSRAGIRAPLAVKKTPRKAASEMQPGKILHLTVCPRPVK